MMQNFVLPYLYTNPIGLKEHLPPRVCLLTCGIEYYLVAPEKLNNSLD